jgi:cytochrome c peroxidase
MSGSKLLRHLKAALIAFVFVISCLQIGPWNAAAVSASPQDNLTDSAQGLRENIRTRVGSLAKLQVPERNEDLPQPLLADGTPDPLYKITEAKRYLGKQLYFDPVRQNRIRPEFGGDFSTKQLASCGSCHLGEVAGKAGLVVNLAQGAEGRGYTDAQGNFHVRRRLIPGKVDLIPTGIQHIVDSQIVSDGRFDMVDSVPRMSPSMIGFGFNNRLLLDGKAQPAPDPNNAFGLPTHENQITLAFDVHRMLETQKEALQGVPVYVKLFQDAFPAEAAKAAASGNLNDLINDVTIARAVATFLRTVVTRNTPWDKFLAGNDAALSARQRRGAKLFITKASEGGANCISCHSGPMLNKQLGDEAGELVEENFYNLGIGEHPLRELARTALNDPNHHDLGRGDITGRAEDNYKFRVLTLRQLKDSGGQLMHSALFKSVREVVEYFNRGIPQDPLASAAGTVSERFTRPRGKDAAPGLGLSQEDISALVDFIENGLYDPAFAHFNPSSTTDTFELNERDLKYSVYRPALIELGAQDKLVASGLCKVNDDKLTRRDLGLEFLEVGSQIRVSRREVSFGFGSTQIHRLMLTNISDAPVDTHLLLCFKGLPIGTIVSSAEGFTKTTLKAGMPYQRVYLPDGEIAPGQSVSVTIQFVTAYKRPLIYDLDFLSGQGTP